jgi:hypothetical protein
MTVTTENPRRSIRVKRSKIPPAVGRRTAAVREKQKRAAELRAAGVAYGVIAEELGYSHASSAKKAVDAFVQDQERELAKEIILLDLVRLDEMQMRAYADIRQGNLKMIPTVLQIMEARYRLLGVSSRTVEELQEQFGISPNGPQGGQVVNNGVMVIGGSESDFVRSLMIATGNDPDDPKVKAQVDAIATARTVRERQYKLLPEKDAPSTEGTPIEEAEIVDAEIIEE